MTITYGMITETYEGEEGERRVSYGMAAYADAEKNGTTSIVASAADISGNRERVSVLVKLCNEGQLSLCHFADVIEDFLAE